MNKLKLITSILLFNFLLLFLPSFVFATTSTAESECSAVKNNHNAYTACTKEKDSSVCKPWYSSYVKDFRQCDTKNATAYEQCYKGVNSSANSVLSSLSKAKSSYKDQSACLSSARSYVSTSRSTSIKKEEDANKKPTSGEYPEYEINYKDSPCANEGIANAVKVVGKIISIIQIVVPILLVIMAMVDITKSIVSGDDAKSRKNITTLIKRLISAVIIFFVIAIIKLVCQLVGDDSFDSCLSLIAKPW